MAPELVMAAPPGPALRLVTEPSVAATLLVEADLTVAVGTPCSGVVVGRVLGDGARLSVHLNRPEVLGTGIDRRSLGQIADLLARVGIVARIIGPQGPVATLGSGVASRVGTMVTGSPRVAFSLRRGTVNAASPRPESEGGPRESRQCGTGQGASRPGAGDRLRP